MVEEEGVVAAKMRFPKKRGLLWANLATLIKSSTTKGAANLTDTLRR